MKPATVNATVAREITRLVQAELKALEIKYGMRFTLKPKKYTDEFFTCDFTASVIRTDSSAETPEKRAFKLHAAHFGFKPEDWSRLFICQGKAYRVSGLVPTAPKFPVLGKRVSDGKEFKFQAESVRHGFQLASAIGEAA